MQFWGSIIVVATLSVIHLSIHRWRILSGPKRNMWLSISAGTALAYVFAYLLPKLAAVQLKLEDNSFGLPPFAVKNSSYLLALCGLLTFLALEKSLTHNHQPAPLKDMISIDRNLILQFLGYGFYNLQLGYLISELPNPAALSYILVLVVLGLHLIGVNYHIFKHHTKNYVVILRWVYIIAIFSGWLIGIFSDAEEIIVVLASTFLAGGIIINAIRDELPSRQNAKPLVFFVAVFIAYIAILTVIFLQS